MAGTQVYTGPTLQRNANGGTFYSDNDNGVDTANVGRYRSADPNANQTGTPFKWSDPEGYTWDSTKNSYVPNYQSVATKNSQYDQLQGMLKGIVGGAMPGAGSAMQGPQQPAAQSGATSQTSAGSPTGGSTAGPNGPAGGGQPGQGQEDGGLAAAQDAGYARAKDKIGQQMRSALMSLKDSASEAGQYSAGGQNPALAAGETQLVKEGQGELGDVVRTQAEDANNANWQEHMAQMGYDSQANLARLGYSSQLNNQSQLMGQQYQDQLGLAQYNNAAATQRSLLNSVISGIFGGGGLY